MPLSLPKFFKPAVVSVGAMSAAGEDPIQQVSKKGAHELQPQDDSHESIRYGVDNRSDVRSFCSSCGEVESPETSEPISGSDSSTKRIGISSRLIRSIRANLRRGSALGRPSSTSSKDKKASPRRNPVEEQVEVARRINCYLTAVFVGSNEPHPLFVGEKEPPISFQNYVQRLIELTNKWVEEKDGSDSFGVRCAILAVDYLERIDVRLEPRSIHRYYMAAFLIGIKLLYDYYISNSFWAEVSGCPRKQVNQMEVQLCRALRWDFNVDSEQHAVSVSRFTR